MLKALLLAAAIAVSQPPAPAVQPLASPAAASFARELMSAPADEDRRALLETRAALISLDLTRGLLEEGVRLLQQGALPRALTAFRLARHVAERANTPVGVAGAASRIAQTLSALGESDEALSQLRESESIYRSLGEKRSELQVLNNQAIVHRLRGDLEAALAIQRRVLAAREADGEPTALAVTLNNIGVLQLARGEYRDALAVMQRALGYRKPGTPEHASALHNVGSVYFAQGDLAAARDYFERVIPVSSIDSMLLLNNLTMLAELSRKQGDLPSAARYAEQVVERANQNGAKPMVSTGLRVLGSIVADRGDLPAARTHLERSLTVARSLDNPDVLGQALVAYANILADQRDFAAALAAADEALALGDALNAGSRISASHVAGLAHAGLERPLEARRAFEAAIANVETQREQVSGEAIERQLFLEANVAPYHSLIDLLIDRQQFDEALRYAERARARTLLDVLQRGHVTLDRWLTVDERAQERRLEQNIRVLQRRSSAASTAGQSRSSAPAASASPSPHASSATPASAATPRANATVNATADELAAARRELAILRGRLFAAHPELRLARGEAAIPSRADITAALVDPSTAVLAYTVTGRRVWLFVLSGETMTVHPLKMEGPALAARVRAFREAIGSRDLGFTADARSLYDELIAPAAAALRGKTRLILIPDGALWELPFQALRSPVRRYLLEDADIAYAPSLTFLYERRRHQQHPQPQNLPTQAQRPQAQDPQPQPPRHDQPQPPRAPHLAERRTPPRDLLAFGNPTLAADDAATFKPLPSAETQARRIAALYPASRAVALIGPAAREAAVKREAAHYRVLHFATHGVVDDGNPLYSALLMAAGPESGADATATDHPSEDGRLEARELMDIPLDADLVVLSACDTARGRIGAGEGVVGLSWAILLAGSASTVVSQWQVDADSTSTLMIGFHRARLRSASTSDGSRGLRPTTQATHATRAASSKSARPSPASTSSALRRAALDVMRDPRYAHPFYWASFRVVGAP